jgi:hypothetical protein
MEIIGQPIAGFIVGILLIVIGIFFAFYSDLVLKFQVWQQKKIMRKDYAPNKITKILMRVVGIVFLISGIIGVYLGFAGYGMIP